jgi:hypothetical protein
MFRLKPDYEQVLERFEGWWQCAVIDRPLYSLAYAKGSSIRGGCQETKSPSVPQNGESSPFLPSSPPPTPPIPSDSTPGLFCRSSRRYTSLSHPSGSRFALRCKQSAFPIPLFTGPEKHPCRTMPIRSTQNYGSPGKSRNPNPTRFMARAK